MSPRAWNVLLVLSCVPLAMFIFMIAYNVSHDRPAFGPVIDRKIEGKR